MCGNENWMTFFRSAENVRMAFVPVVHGKIFDAAPKFIFRCVAPPGAAKIVACSSNWSLDTVAWHGSPASHGTFALDASVTSIGAVSPVGGTTNPFAVPERLL